MTTEPLPRTHPTDRGRARRLWHLVEPIHAVAYFSPEPIAAYATAGSKGFWMGYVASRAAPLGPVAAEPVISLFANFHPRRIRRALPDAWALTTPGAMLAARSTGSAATLRRLWDAVEPATLATLADRLSDLAEAAPSDGRGLFAANLTVPRPVDDIEALWRAATLLREHRGDGHVAAYVVEGLTGIQANLLQVGTGRMSSELLRTTRAWEPEEWQAEADRLRRWGLLDTAGAATEAGHDTLLRVEAATDRAAWGALATLAPAELDLLESQLAPLARAVLAAGEVPVPNPMGLRPDSTS